MAAGKTIDIIKVGEVGTTSVALNSFLAALETCSGVNDTIQIDGIDYILSSVEFGGNPSGAATWGAIAGDILDQADLQAALALKADLVGGKVPASQLPSYVDDVLEFANQAAFPATGETGKIYVAMDINHCFRWSGSAYVDVTQNDMGNGNQNYIPQILLTSGGKIIKYKNSAISDDGDTFSASLGAAGQLAGVRSTGAIGMFSQTSESHVSVGGPTSPGGGYTRIHSTIANYVTGKPITYRLVAEATPGEIAVFDASNQLVSQKRVLPITRAEAEALRDSSAIVSGQAYLITDAADLGIVVIGSPNPRQFLREALGGYLNADYQDEGDYDLIESVTGFAKGTNLGILNAGNTIGCLNGDVGIFEDSLYQIIDRDLADGENPASAPLGFYKFERSAFTTERVGYLQVWNQIEYNFDGNITYWRFYKDSVINGNSISTFPFGDDKISWQQNDSECIIECMNQEGYIIGYSNNAGQLIANENQGSLNEIEVSNGYYNITLDAGQYINRWKFTNSGSFTIPPNLNFSNGELTDNGSTFELNIDVSGFLDLDFTGVAGFTDISFAGVLYLTSSDTDQVIGKFVNRSAFFDITIRIQTGSSADIVFSHSPAQIINSRDVNVPVTDFSIGRNSASFAIFQCDQANSRHILINGVKTVV